MEISEEKIETIREIPGVTEVNQGKNGQIEAKVVIESEGKISGSYTYNPNGDQDFEIVFSAGDSDPYSKNAGPDNIRSYYLGNENDNNAGSVIVYNSAASGYHVSNHETNTSTLDDTLSEVKSTLGVEDPKYRVYALESASAGGYDKMNQDKGAFDIFLIEPKSSAEDFRKNFIGSPAMETMKENSGAIYACEAIGGQHFPAGKASQGLGNYCKIANEGIQTYLVVNKSYTYHAVSATEGAGKYQAPSNIIASDGIRHIATGASVDVDETEGYKYYDLSGLFDPNKGERLSTYPPGALVNASSINVEVFNEEKNRWETVREYKVNETTSDFEILDENGNDICIDEDELGKNAYNNLRLSNDPFLSQVGGKYSGHKASELYLPAENPDGVGFDFDKALDEVVNLSNIMEKIDSERSTLGKVDFSKVRNVEKPNCPSCMNNIV